VKILTATFFFVLMFGFVAFRSGAFDGTRSAQLKLHVSRTGLSHHHKSKTDSKTTKLEKPDDLPHREIKGNAVKYVEMDHMAASSKTLITAPVNWSSFFGSPEFSMMAGSKSAGVVSAPASSVYGGVFSTPYWWKASRKGEQLKQGKK
jgi:hypothetical protein